MTEIQEQCKHTETFEWATNDGSGGGASSPTARKMVSCKKCYLLLNNYPELLEKVQMSSGQTAIAA